MAGVADDHGVRLDSRPAKEPRLRDGETQSSTEPRPPLLPLTLPDRHMSLDDLDARAAKAGDHLGVAGVAALVRPEVEDPHA